MSALTLYHVHVPMPLCTDTLLLHTLSIYVLGDAADNSEKGLPNSYCGFVFLSFLQQYTNVFVCQETVKTPNLVIQ